MICPTNASARPNIRLQNVEVTFVSNPDTTTNTDFPYRASVTAEGVTDLMSATVMFSQDQAISGNYATYCQTGTDVVYVYAKTDPGAIIIPAISCDLSVNYINVDNVPTENSQAVITSGGVYDNCVRTSGNQNVAGTKTFTNDPWIVRPQVPTLILKDTTNDVATPTSAWTSCGVVRYLDKNDQHFAVVECVQEQNYRAIYFNLNTSRTTNTDHWSGQIGLGSNADNVIWAFAPYRTSNLSDNDILTKGNMWASTSVTTTTSGAGIIQRYGKLVVVKIYGLTVNSTGQFQPSGITIPKPINHANCTLTSGTGALIGTAYADAGWTTINFHAVSTGTAYGTMVYFTNDA